MTAVATAAAVTINDTSKTPTYAVAPAATSVNEGSALVYTVTTTNVADGTVLNYTLAGTGITTGDTTVPLTGTVTINNNTAIAARRRFVSLEFVMA